MSKNDLDLIKKSNKCSCADHYLVNQMIEKAESKEAKEYLKSRSNYLYHLEEYYAGLL